MFTISIRKTIWLLVVTVVLAVTSMPVTAQQRLPKYETLYKDAIAANDKGYAYALFSEFLKQNSNSNKANLYFQLGNLASYLAQTLDPIAQYSNFITYSDAADLYLKLCMKYLNESEVKRDNEMYQGIAAANKKLTFEEVYTYVNQKIEDNKSLNRNIRKVYVPYKELVYHYNTCQSTYKMLCDKFVNIKDAYLMVDKDVTNPMQTMKLSFDSVKYYLNEYKIVLEKNPVKNYDAGYTLQKITTFRIDGLSSSNFRNGKSVVWNYGEWAAQFLQSIDAFAALYQEVVGADDELNKRINTFNSNRTLSNNYLGFEVDNTMMDSLNLFGYFPALNRLISYKEEKLNFLTQSRRKINSTDYNADKVTITNKMYYYYTLQLKYNKLEAMRQELENYATSASAGFLSAGFKNRDEFVEYVHDELIENTAELNLAYNNLKTYCVNLENNIRTNRHITYKKQDIPLYLDNGFFRPSLPQGWITKCIVPAASNNGFYLAGSSISKEGFSTAYVALCADSATVSWLKTVDVGRVMYDNCATAICPTIDGGCFAIIVAKNVSDPTLVYHTVIHFDAKGNEVKRFTLPEKTLGIGRYIAYNDVSEQLLMAFYGDEEFWYDSNNAKLVLQQIDMSNNQLMRAEIKMNGALVDILSGNNNELLIVGNYNSITDEKGVEHKVESKQITIKSNIFTAVVSSEGKLLTVNRYDSNESGYAIKAIKVGADAVSIVGQKGDGRKDDTVPFTSADLIYLLIDDNGKIIFSSQKDITKH